MKREFDRTKIDLMEFCTASELLIEERLILFTSLKEIIKGAKMLLDVTDKIERLVPDGGELQLDQTAIATIQILILNQTKVEDVFIEFFVANKNYILKQLQAVILKILDFEELRC